VESLAGLPRRWRRPLARAVDGNDAGGSATRKSLHLWTFLRTLGLNAVTRFDELEENDLQEVRHRDPRQLGQALGG